MWSEDDRVSIEGKYEHVGYVKRRGEPSHSFGRRWDDNGISLVLHEE